MVAGLKLRSIVATLVFLMILIVLGLILQKYPNPSDPIFSFLATLFIGCFLALIVCLSNIGEIVENNKISSETTTANSIKFSSCPEYWKKVRDDNNIGTKCTNNFKSNFLNSDLGQNISELNDEAVYETSTTDSGGQTEDDWIKEGPPQDDSGAEVPTGYSMEIDLDQINKTSNPCQLSKYFAWTEARSKCQA